MSEHVTPIVHYKYTYEEKDLQSLPSQESKGSVKSQTSGQVLFLFLSNTEQVNFNCPWENSTLRQAIYYKSKSP